MKTNKRLSQAYNNAEVISIDAKSKYIFFSDIHRGDDSVSDEFARNQTVLLHALDYYYEQGYCYAEVGDGDELWEHKDFKIIRRAHGDIFTVMKKFFDQERLCILYGNHNINLRNREFVKANYYRYYDEYKQEYCDFFPGLKVHEALVLKDENTGQEIFVVHGHQGDILNDRFWWISMMLLRYFWKYLHVVGFRNPSSPARNQHIRHKLEINYKKWIREHKKILICGHTHRQRFPKRRELPYFNTGCCIRTKGITGIELAEGKLSMVEWRMRADTDGVMRITRTVIQGPRSIERYFKKSYEE